MAIAKRWSLGEGRKPRTTSPGRADIVRQARGALCPLCPLCLSRAPGRARMILTKSIQIRQTSGCRLDRAGAAETHPPDRLERDSASSRGTTSTPAGSEKKRGPASSRGQTPTPAGSERKRGPASSRCEADSGWHEGAWEPSRIPFTAFPGPRGAAEELDSDLPADFLELFITDELLQHVVDQTNLYACQYFQAHPESLPHSRGDQCQCRN